MLNDTNGWCKAEGGAAFAACSNRHDKNNNNDNGGPCVSLSENIAHWYTRTNR